MSKFRLAATAALLPLAAFALSSSIAVAAPGAKGAEQVRVIVAYKDGQRGNAERALAMAGADVHYDFASRRGYAQRVPVVAVEGLVSQSGDRLRRGRCTALPARPRNQEVVPYGITMTNVRIRCRAPRS